MLLKTAIAAGMLVALPFAASAAPVGVWDVAASSRFDTTQTRVVRVIPPLSTNEGTRLAWRDQQGVESALRLGDNPPGTDADVQPVQRISTVGVNGVQKEDEESIGQAVSLTHVNRPLIVSEAPVLSSGVLSTTATFTAADDASITAMQTLNIPFFFRETMNAPDSGVCADGNAPPENGCPDLFITAATSLEDTFTATDGVTYRARFFTDAGFEMLDPSLCAMVDIEGACLGFETMEGQDTTVNFQFDIAAVPLPPAVLLMASGLVGAGFVSRRRRKAAA